MHSVLRDLFLFIVVEPRVVTMIRVAFTSNTNEKMSLLGIRVNVFLLDFIKCVFHLRHD